MRTKIAINGFGRIGRAVFKLAQENKDVEVVAINDLMDNQTLAYLLKHDTVYGEYPKSIRAKKNSIIVDKVEYPVFSIREPNNLPWKKLKIDVVLECTGRFRTSQDAKKHINVGAKKVVLSAPGKGSGVETFVFGTKQSTETLKKDADIISNASCTTNCISPVMQVLVNKFGVEKAMLTTIHAYTSSQNIIDGPHKDLRRGRAGAQNMVPTTTGAAIAACKVIPDLENVFDGIAIRVPVVNGSISDITCLLKRKRVTVKQVNDTFKDAVKTPLYKNVLAVSTKPLVSSDFIGSPYSSIVDLPMTTVIGGNMVKILAWYDNEWGYSNRLLELAIACCKTTK